MEKVTGRKGVADTLEAWIYYKESGHGTPILMLHGNAQTHLVFSYYEKQLSRKYRVILMDSVPTAIHRSNPSAPGKNLPPQIWPGMLPPFWTACI